MLRCGFIQMRQSVSTTTEKTSRIVWVDKRGGTTVFPDVVFEGCGVKKGSCKIAGGLIDAAATSSISINI
jgi:hypothetical protein